MIEGKSRLQAQSPRQTEHYGYRPEPKESPDMPPDPEIKAIFIEALDRASQAERKGVPRPGLRRLAGCAGAGRGATRGHRPGRQLPRGPRGWRSAVCAGAEPDRADRRHRGSRAGSVYRRRATSRPPSRPRTAKPAAHRPATPPRAPARGSARTSCCRRSARAAWVSSTSPTRSTPSAARSR